MKSLFLKRFISLVAFSLPVSLLASASLAIAQSSSSGQGLSITPFLLERSMQKGDTTNEIIEITNTSDHPLPVSISINDFVPIGTNGGEQFLDPGQGDPHYSLSSWIKITSNPKPELQPNEKTDISFTITPPSDAEDGGHYGAILFTFQPVSAQGTAVSVQQKLGAIILVKLGKANESGQIVKFAPEHWFSQYPPVNLVTRFKNTGNVHVAPRGSILVSNMFGKTIANVAVNENANNVLANTERDFTSTWKDSFGFGRYTATEKLVYGDSGQVAIASTSFWVIPIKTSLITALVLFIIIIIFIFFVRRYNRWILSQAYGRTPARRKKS